MDRKDWNRIGLAAAVLLVPGGFLLGATLLARRGGKMAGDAGGTGKAADGPNPPAASAEAERKG